MFNWMERVSIQVLLATFLSLVVTDQLGYSMFSVTFIGRTSGGVTIADGARTPAGPLLQRALNFP